MNKSKGNFSIDDVVKRVEELWEERIAKKENYVVFVRKGDFIEFIKSMKEKFEKKPSDKKTNKKGLCK